jgi:hypothetical protein
MKAFALAAALALTFSGQAAKPAAPASGAPARTSVTVTLVRWPFT